MAILDPFTQGFSHLLRRRRVERHFEPGPLPGAEGAPAAALARLQSHADGLGDAEAARRSVARAGA